MTGLIVIATLIALIASFVIISTRQTKPRPQPAKRRVKRQPMNICMMKRRALKRQQRREQQHLLLLAFVVQWQYRQVRAQA